MSDSEFNYVFPSFTTEEILKLKKLLKLINIKEESPVTNRIYIDAIVCPQDIRGHQ